MNATISGINDRRLFSSGALTIPASKSHTIRALLIASMAGGESSLINPLDSADARSCITACRALGAEVVTGLKTRDGLSLWKVRGNGGRFPGAIKEIDTGNSGTTLYLAAGLAALASAEVGFTGDSQIKRRPVKPLLDSLKDLGAQVEISGSGGCPPFTLRGPLKGGRTSIECPTSQYLSSLLLCAPLAAGESVIEVPLLMEQPYAEMTLRWLEGQGISCVNEGFKRFTIPGGQKYHSFTSLIPGDFSSAAFPLAAAAVTGSRLELAGLDTSDSQGDKAVLEYLREMGCLIEPSAGGSGEAGLISVTGPGHPDNPCRALRGAEFDLNDTPDALPAMAAAACFAGGRTVLYNVPQARLKETDRIAVMRTELSKLGARIEETDDGLIIHGAGSGPGADTGKLKGCRLEGHGDHRVVMALAVAALRAEGKTVVSDAEAVDITYPDFFKMLDSITGER